MWLVSKSKYVFEQVSMTIKLIPGDSAGTVTAFYVCNHPRYCIFCQVLFIKVCTVIPNGIIFRWAQMQWQSAMNLISSSWGTGRGSYTYIVQTYVYAWGKGDKRAKGEPLLWSLWSIPLSTPFYGTVTILCEYHPHILQTFNSIK